MKMETFRKGQIVPRRLRMALTDDRKAQHCIKWGCDVKVFGRHVMALTAGAVFVIPDPAGRPMNNRTRKRSNVLVKNVHADFTLVIKEAK